MRPPTIMQIIPAPLGARVWESRCDRETQPVLCLALIQDDSGRRVVAHAMRQGIPAFYELAELIEAAR